MKKLMLLFALMLLPLPAFAAEIVWHNPEPVANLGYFPAKPANTVLLFGHYEELTKTFSIARVIQDSKEVGQIYLMLPNRTLYGQQVRIYVFHTNSTNKFLRDISTPVLWSMFIKKPEYIQSRRISLELQKLATPKTIDYSSLHSYSFESLGYVETLYSSGSFTAVGTFLNTKTNEKQAMYTETKSGSANGFYLRRPDNTMELYFPHLKFLGNSPQILWDDGVKRKTHYSEQDTPVCWIYPAASLLRVVTDKGAPILVWPDSNWPKTEWIPFDEKSLKKIGKTKSGKDVYILPDSDPIYAIYYNKYFPVNTEGKEKKGLQKFIDGKPFLFYKDELGRYIFLINTAYYNVMYCA